MPLRPRSDRAVPLEFSGDVWFWKGPAPWQFVTVPEAECMVLDELAMEVTYGWGMIPVTAQLGGTTWETSLFPKDGRYLVPIKARLRKLEGVELDDVVTLRLHVGGDGDVDGGADDARPR